MRANIAEYSRHLTTGHLLLSAVGQTGSWVRSRTFEFACALSHSHTQKFRRPCFFGIQSKVTARLRRGALQKRQPLKRTQTYCRGLKPWSHIPGVALPEIYLQITHIPAPGPKHAPTARPKLPHQASHPGIVICYPRRNYIRASQVRWLMIFLPFELDPYGRTPL